MKICSKCKITKALDEFPKSINKSGRAAGCKSCASFYWKHRYKTNPEFRARHLARSKALKGHPEIRERRQKYYKTLLKTQLTYKEQVRNSAIKRLYGLTPEDWDNLFNSQNRKCALCNKTHPRGRWCVDHCHTTNKVRGILCSSCNVALGFYEKLKKQEAIVEDYLLKSKAYL